MLCNLCGIEMRRIAERDGKNVFICRNVSCPNKDKEIAVPIETETVIDETMDETSPIINDEGKTQI